MIVLLSDQVEEVGNAMIGLLIPRLFQFCGERRHLRIPNIFLNDGLHSKMHLSAAVAPMDMTITAAVLGISSSPVDLAHGSKFKGSFFRMGTTLQTSK